MAGSAGDGEAALAKLGGVSVGIGSHARTAARTRIDGARIVGLQIGMVDIRGY
jgi:hypothetical protein